VSAKATAAGAMRRTARALQLPAPSIARLGTEIHQRIPAKDKMKNTLTLDSPAQLFITELRRAVTLNFVKPMPFIKGIWPSALRLMEPLTRAHVLDFGLMSAAAVHDRTRELSASDHRARLIPPRCVHPRQDRLLSVSLALGMPIVP